MSDVTGSLITDKRAWKGEDFSSDADWVFYWSDVAMRGLADMADRLPEDSADWLDFDVSGHLDAQLSSELDLAGQSLAEGRGFVLLRGLNASDPERLRRMFWIVGNCLGKPVMQNAKGEVLSVVMDRFAGAQRGVDTRGYESNDELRFHCDGGDCIGMSCVQQAEEGGLNGLVSLFSIYNEIVQNHPQHLEVLTKGFPLYSRKEKGDAQSTQKLGQVQQTRIPVFAWQEGRMSAWLNIQLAELAAQVSEQTYSAAEQSALSTMEEVANDGRLQLTFKQQPGDILFVNNLAVMHRREKYTDQAGEQKRKLYRMWINLHSPQPLVAQHAALRRGIRGPSPVLAS